MVKERPILFSAPMVRAILEGRKTQTRRLVTLREFQKSDTSGYDFCFRGHGGCWQDVTVARMLNPPRSNYPFKCPYGKPGDRLWVREQLTRPDGDPWCYAADQQPVMVRKPDETAMLTWAHHKEQDYCPSIHAPRWASRITLEITGVRVERVQEISEDDAIAEGAMFHNGHGVGHSGWRHDLGNAYVYRSARDSFSALWQQINGKRPGCAWADNPFCWVISFRISEGNVTR